jgi:hypothetical protein
MVRAKYVVQVFGKKRNGGRYHGTGFLLNPRGDVATCWHVVEDARDIFVKLPYMDKWTYQVFAKRKREDIAVLQIKVPPGEKTAYATLHPDWFSTDKIGAHVRMFGYADRRNTQFANQKNFNVSNVMNLYGLIVVHGDVNKGDSGGPVLNGAGHVIGIATYGSDLRGHAMVRPISRLCELLKKKRIPFGRPRGTGHFAKQAINSLPALMRKQEVRKAVQKYGSIFEKSSRQISILYAYKKVHDLLHEMEFGCYNSMVQDARRFPHQQSARDNMRSYLVRLGDHLSNADHIVNDDIEGDKRVLTVRDQLKKAYQALQRADRGRDIKHCKSAIELLGLLISWAQSSFNADLNRVARELDIDNLVAAMQSVHKVILRAKLSRASVDKFGLGVGDLAALARDLHMRTMEHDQWQQMDNVLRVMDRKSSNLLSKMEIHWPIIVSEIEAVCSLAPAAAKRGETVTASSWSALIKQETRSLKKALTSRDLRKARLHFGSLHQHAAERFDSVDKKLLWLCEKITKMKNPLRTLVENL